MLRGMLCHPRLVSAIIVACLAGRIKSLLRLVGSMIRLSLRGCCSASLGGAIFK